MRPTRIAPFIFPCLLLLPLLSGVGCTTPASASRSDAVIPGKGVPVLAAGDIADCRRNAPQDSGAEQTAKIVSAELDRDPSALVLALGDNTYPIGLISEFTDCYEPTWGRFRKRTLPVPGNHEYYSPEAAGYYRYFGKAAAPERRGYYSRQVGEWQVIALNSNLKPELHAEQMTWLKNELERNRRACTLAFWHHPRHSSGGHGSSLRMDDAWRLLAEHGAEVVLAAHDHNYERFAPLDAEGKPDARRGMRSFVVGTGGARLTPLRFPKPHSDIADNTTHGVLKLTLKPTGYDWEFLPVVEDGFTDRGSAYCSRE